MPIMKKFFLLSTLYLITASKVICQWDADNYDTKVSVTKNLYSYQTKSVTDGSNGSIIVFKNQTAHGDVDTVQSFIKAQRLDSNGVVKWGSISNPKIISGSDYYQDLKDVISDGNGGAFASWIGYRTEQEDGSNSGNLYVQHIDKGGSTSWTSSGQLVSTNALYSNDYAKLCLDGTGGVFVTWHKIVFIDTISYADIYVQHLNSAGSLLWNPAGIQVAIAGGFRLFPQIVTDDAGGAIICFVDTRNGSYHYDPEDRDNTDIYAQRLDANGNRLWNDTGVIVSNAPSNQFLNIEDYGYKRLVSDGNGGAILVFDDYRQNGNRSSNNLYAQKINNNGLRQWTENGVEVRTSGSTKYVGNVNSDGIGGILLSWNEGFRDGQNFIYAQRLSSLGSLQWTSTAILLDEMIYSDYFIGESDIISDRMGNFIVTWTNYSDEYYEASKYIKAQKINDAGQTQWGIGKIINTVDDYASNSTIVTAEDGATIIAWKDGREGGSDIFANKILSNGEIVTSDILPLKLVQFDASPLEDEVLLSWTTENEFNTKSFLVERSSDNVNFSNVGSIAAVRNNPLNSKYNFTDDAPLSGISFYRLKMYDAAGTFSYSSVKKITIGLPNLKVKILSNPLKDKATMLLTAKKASKVEFILYNITGQALIKGTKQLVQGQQQIELNIAYLSSGIYKLVIQNKEEKVLLTIKK